MTIKKMALLAVSAMALLAFAIPSMASASDEWYTGNTTITGEDTVELDGTLEVSVPLAGATLGPCEVDANIIVWNEGGAATGEVDEEEFEITVGTGTPTCGAFFPPSETCDIVAAEGHGGHIHVATGPTNIKITNASFGNVLGAGCPNHPVAGAAGTATGTWNNETSCVEFNNDGDLLVPPNIPAFITGELCDTTEQLNLQ